MVRFFDLYGKERSTSWATDHYGVVFTQGRSDKWRLAELREVEGEPVLTVTIPGDTTRIECYFFGYEIGMMAAHNGVEGIVTFPLPLNFTYKLAGQGTHWLNVDGLRVIGLGVPDNVQNWRHLDVVLEECA